MTIHQRIIEILVKDKQEQLSNDPDFLRQVLADGFQGFSKMNASQLHAAVYDAGLDTHDDMEQLLQELSKKDPLSASLGL